MRQLFSPFLYDRNTLRRCTSVASRRAGGIRFVLTLLLPALAGFQIGCERLVTPNTDSSIPPPLLLWATSSISAVNTDTINVGPTRKSDDLIPIALTITAKVDGIRNPAPRSVQLRISNPADFNVLTSGELNDDGTAGDQTKGDGIYSIKTSLQFQRVETGVLTIEVQALGTNGYQSNTIILPLLVYRGNHAPLISLVTAADTVRLLNESQLLTLRIKVSDEDGLADVSRVVFNSYRPDSSASSGNPFLMYDDGSATHGDEKSADGIYSLIVTLPPTTQPGTYRFEFIAYDRSNAVSPTLVHRMTVIP